MCGILGFFETGGNADRRAMEATGGRMAAAIAHRGPDDEGLWQDPDRPVLLGQRRLSIIDLSPEGHQPKMSHSGRYVISYNGEIYNFQDLHRELESAGTVFKGRSDTEVMLAAFDRWGVNRALQKFNGMFAFALWDRTDGILHLVRDRLGKKPLYVGWARKTFVFASELKALRAHPDFVAAINPDTAALYMRYGYVPAPHCIYKNIWQIPPGARLTLAPDTVTPSENIAARMESYWPVAQAATEAQRTARTSNSDTVTDLETLLAECVRDRMIADVPLGAFLSGGIDSSLVVALMQHQAARPVKTFTVGFEEAGYDEAAHAKKIAAHLGTDHHEIVLTAQDALAVVPRLPDLYDEPFSDESQIPTYLMCKFARQSVSVALTGDGGDEMFGGYARHAAAPALLARTKKIPLPLRRLAAAGIKSLPPGAWDKIAPGHPRFGERLHKAAALLPLSSAEEMYRRLLTRWPDAEALVPGAILPPERMDDPALRPAGLDFAARMMFGDTLSYLPDDVLVKVDRASMAVALECRAPLLDRRIFDFAWSLPMDQKIHAGRGKMILRRVLARHVPESFFERPKQGFSVPVASWLTGPLREWAADMLDPVALARAGLGTAPIRAVWSAFLKGETQHAPALWTVLMFQSWYRRWMT